MSAARRLIRVVGYSCDIEICHDAALDRCWCVSVLHKNVPTAEIVGSRSNGPAFLTPNVSSSNHYLQMQGVFLQLPLESWQALKGFCEDVREAEAIRRAAAESLPSHLPHIAAPSSLETRQ